VPVAAIVPARTVHRQARAALGSGFAADGFGRLKSTSIAAWARPTADQFIVGWVQPSRDPDAFGWYGTKFTIEFRRGARPAVAVNGPIFRFCNLLDDDGREQVRAVQGRQVAAPYGPMDDVWFRHRDMQDLADWFRLLPALLPAALAELRHRLG
jgi:hypothetical protein